MPTRYDSRIGNLLKTNRAEEQFRILNHLHRLLFIYNRKLLPSLVSWLSTDFMKKKVSTIVVLGTLITRLHHMIPQILRTNLAPYVYNLAGTVLKLFNRTDLFNPICAIV
jgi:hypothetical protein